VVIIAVRLRKVSVMPKLQHSDTLLLEKTDSSWLTQGLTLIAA